MTICGNKMPQYRLTLRFWVIAIIVPMVIFLLYDVYRRDVYDFHHAILGLLFSVLVTAVITDAIKDAVGCPRPDFFWRCFPDGSDGALQDVFAGGILGSIVAIFCYLQFFPAPYDADGWGPYAYFQMVAESGNALEQTGTVDAVRVQRTETETVYQQVTEQSGAFRMHGNIGHAV